MHPDYKVQCGAWLDLSDTYCGACERCKRHRQLEAAGIVRRVPLTDAEKPPDPDYGL